MKSRNSHTNMKEYVITSILLVGSIFLLYYIKHCAQCANSINDNGCAKIGKLRVKPNEHIDSFMSFSSFECLK